MSSRDLVLASIEALRAYPQKSLLDPRVRDLMHAVTAALMALPDGEKFLAGLLGEEFAGLGGRGDLLVCACLHGAIAERKIREALPVLNRMLVDPRAKAMHEDLAETLGQIGDENTVPYLILALSSDEVWVRAKAARSLARLADVRAVQPLTSLLKDESDTVRENAMEALVEMGVVEASDMLLAIAVSREESSYLRAQAIEAMEHLRIRKAVPLLRRLCQEEEDEDILGAATRAVAKLENSE